MTTNMNTVYRIYTEDADREAVVRAVSQKFESFTLHATTGYFKGRAEKSIVIEIVEASERDVNAIARMIRAISGQKTVLVMGLRGQARKITVRRTKSGS
jgi:hypothetical protein